MFVAHKVLPGTCVRGELVVPDAIKALWNWLPGVCVDGFDFNIPTPESGRSGKQYHRQRKYIISLHNWIPAFIAASV